MERILIVDVNGRVLFDSVELDELEPRRQATAPDRWILEPARLTAIQGVDNHVLPARDAAGAPGLEIVAPYFEEWGKHRVSVLYEVSYKSLKPKIARLILTTAALTLLSIVASVIVAAILGRRITRPVQELTEGAKDIAEGHFDRRLVIDTPEDELRVLAEAFNHMTGRLKENVEKLEESNAKLATANEELKELDRLKSDLLANVSHELRTPLTAIKGYTDYILERKLGAITEKQEKGLVVVQRNLDRLSKSINALLDFSRMDVGRIALNLQPFHLGPLVDQIHTSLRSELEKKRLSFRAELEPELAPVIADRDKISAVLENLIINAIKFTPDGGSIAASAVRVPGAARPSVEIRVADTGVGIPVEQIGKVFNRFHQVDGSSTRRFGGVGLGLAIVKTILEAHGTNIEVESRPGHGSAFRFVLPLLGLGRPSGRSGRGTWPAANRLVSSRDREGRGPRPVRGALEAEGLSVLGASTATEAVMRWPPSGGPRPSSWTWGRPPPKAGSSPPPVPAGPRRAESSRLRGVRRRPPRAFSLGRGECLGRAPRRLDGGRLRRAGCSERHRGRAHRPPAGRRAGDGLVVPRYAEERGVPWWTSATTGEARESAAPRPARPGRGARGGPRWGGEGAGRAGRDGGDAGRAPVLPPRPGGGAIGAGSRREADGTHPRSAAAAGRSAPSRPAGRRRAASSERMSQKKKILVVDDEDDILHFLELVLREKGYDVATASGGHEALTKAQIERPNLILLDIMMPQMDGWEVLKLLRVDEETFDIPVAMLSARTEAKDRVQGLQEGAIDYICKPFSLQDLLAKIETIFGQVDGPARAARER